MAKFIVDLSSERRAKLEAHRAAMGLRSEADAVRDLIDRCAATRVIAPDAGRSLRHVAPDKGGRNAERSRVTVRPPDPAPFSSTPVQIGPTSPKAGTLLKPLKGKT